MKCGLLTKLQTIRNRQHRILNFSYQLIRGIGYSNEVRYSNEPRKQVHVKSDRILSSAKNCVIKSDSKLFDQTKKIHTASFKTAPKREIKRHQSQLVIL